ncbi:hypothetical protein [Streptomyces sp. NPDC008240]|uniref:hypothetical protein n=1 Tax=Streptomyces sp. NPDC008240 TaxID=3364822 RepID=UPI0036E28932
MSARDTILLALTRYYQPNTDPRGTAMQVLDGYDAARRTELLSERTDVRDRMLSDAHAAGHAEALANVTKWLIKKAREFHVSSRKREREQGDTCAVLASKIARGAVRPNNLLMLPNAGFFEHGRTYEREGRTFQCIAIEAFPLSGELRAIGWYATSSGGWPSVEALDPDDWKHGDWTDVTEDGAS